MNYWDICLSLEGNTPNWRNIFSLEKSKIVMISFYSDLLRSIDAFLSLNNSRFGNYRRTIYQTAIRILLPLSKLLFTLTLFFFEKQRRVNSLLLNVSSACGMVVYKGRKIKQCCYKRTEI
jgi:hypothetical protein